MKMTDATPELVGKKIRITKINEPESDVIKESDFPNALKVGMIGTVTSFSKNSSPEWTQLWADWPVGNRALVQGDEFEIAEVRS